MQIDGQVYSVRRFIQLHFRFEHKLLGLCVAVLLAYCLFFRLAAALALKKVRGGGMRGKCRCKGHRPFCSWAKYAACWSR